MSVVHVVLFRFEEPEHIEQCVERLQGMVGQVPALRSLSAGANTVPSDRAFDVALVAKFDSHHDLRAYAQDPVHRGVVSWINERATSFVSVDYEE